MGAVAGGDAASYPALHHDRRAEAIGRALVGVIAAEFFLSATGLGQLIMVASQNFDTATVFGIILVIGLLGVGLTRIGQHFEITSRAGETSDGRDRYRRTGSSERFAPRVSDALSRIITGLAHPGPMGNDRAHVCTAVCGQTDERVAGHSARDYRPRLFEAAG